MIIIIGASQGIGRFLFQKFKENGEDVIGTYNSSMVDDDDISFYRQVNVLSCSQISEFVNSLKNLSNIVLINCAGISYNSFAHKADLEMWKRVIDVNLVGTFNVIHSLLPIMRAQGYGRIINFSSVVVNIPTPGVSAYAASKAALNGLTKCLSVENASKGITVNSINLGYTNAGMGINDVPDKFRSEVTLRIPKNRFCKPIEIYQTIKYIIDTDYLTGSLINLDGGLS